MRILGTGSALPEFTLDNDRLTGFLDTSDEWIRTRTGIQSRQVATRETVLSLGLAAANAALENAGVRPEDIDFLICSTVQADTITPSLACVLQGAAGLKCPAIDINGACAGFIYALDFADSILKAGKAKHVLIVCSEMMSRLVDWTDRATCVLFGDGAGAAVVVGGENLYRARLTSEGDINPINYYPDPGNSPFMTDNHPASRLHMAGQDVYKFAVSHSAADLQQVVGESGLSMDEIDHYLLHQANKRILEAVRTRLRQPEAKFPSNVEVRGNTSSASVAILLDELNRAGHFKPGDALAMSAFGAGLTTGSCVIRWTKE